MRWAERAAVCARPLAEVSLRCDLASAQTADMHSDFFVVGLGHALPRSRWCAGRAGQRGSGGSAVAGDESGVLSAIGGGRRLA